MLDKQARHPEEQARSSLFNLNEQKESRTSAKLAENLLYLDIPELDLNHRDRFAKAITGSNDKRLTELCKNATPQDVKDMVTLLESAATGKTRQVRDRVGQAFLAIVASGNNAQSRELAEKEFLKRDWPYATTPEMRKTLIAGSKDSSAVNENLERRLYRHAMRPLGVRDEPDSFVDARAEREARETNLTKSVRKVKDSVVALDIRKEDGKKKVGAGTIIDQRGYILTAAHVVQDQHGITVNLSDKTQLKGTVVFADKKSDIAVIKVNPGTHKLKECALGPSCDLMLGETLFSMGNPYGYRNSLSVGHLSSKEDRIIEFQDNRHRTAQHDTPINPGNSGGGLFLEGNGRLVGMNIALRQDGQGIAFAVKSDAIVDILTKHMPAKHFPRGLTVEGTPILKDELLEQQDLVVKKIAADHPLAKTVRPGDIITAVGGKKFDNPSPNSFDFARALWQYKPGDTIEFSILRDKKPVTVSLTIPREKKK